MDDCCTKGFLWGGTPSGREDKLGAIDAYISGDSTERAILLVHDALGWRFQNSRLLADQYAKEIGATVYMPDFFHGESVDENDVAIKVEGGQAKLETNPGFDFGVWFQKNALDVRMPEVLAAARLLRDKHSWLGAVGFCWGGGIGFRLASKSHSGLVDCISIGHPNAPTEDEVRSISVPFQIIAPEHDPTFPVEAKELCNREIPKLGVEYQYYHFAGMLHGFCTKCDEKNEVEKKALEKAKNAVIWWMRTH